MIKKVILIVLVLRVVAPLTLAGYLWLRNRNKDVSLNFDKIVCGEYIRPPNLATPEGCLVTVS